MDAVGGAIGGVKGKPGFHPIRMIKSAIDKIAHPHHATYQSYDIAVPELLKGAAGGSALVSLRPQDDGFDFPGGDFDPGEHPEDEIGAIEIRANDGELLASFGGFALSFAEVEALDTEAKIERFLFGGDDHLSGGFRDDILDGEAGDDGVTGFGGKDEIHGGAGKDRLDGGSGNDRLAGDGGSDSLFGSGGDDKESGGSGDDLVHGGDGDDDLAGDGGADRIIGAFGADRLTGGRGPDDFVYQTLPQFNDKESGVGPARRDVITDFEHGVDDIDLSFILEARFKFRGERPLTGAGEIRFEHVGNDTLVEVSTDGDRKPELTILLNGIVDLTRSDFVL